MAFSSNAVTLKWERNNLVLSRGASILLIDANNVQTLRTLKTQPEFEEFFRTKALQNREARRVFEAWERKDEALLPKIFQEMTV